MRYFRAPANTAEQLRQGVMLQLGQPNGQADSPWPAGGDFTTSGLTYLALSPHHTEGEFWAPMIETAIAAGAEEISEAAYMAAKPAAQPI